MRISALLKIRVLLVVLFVERFPELAVFEVEIKELGDFHFLQVAVNVSFPHEAPYLLEWALRISLSGYISCFRLFSSLELLYLILLPIE